MNCLQEEIQMLHGVWRLFCEISYCGRSKKEHTKSTWNSFTNKTIVFKQFSLYLLPALMYYMQRENIATFFGLRFWIQLNSISVNQRKGIIYTAKKIVFSNELLSCAYKKQGDFFLNSIQQPTQAAIHEIAYDCLVPLRQEYSRENWKNSAKYRIITTLKV